jgi:small subunit ribosomal protein S6
MEKTKHAYETVLILDSGKSQEELDELLEKFKSLIESSATIDGIDTWGKRRLAYPIDGKLEGHYTLISFTSDSEFPKELDRVYKITDGVIRTLVVRKDERYLDIPPANPGRTSRNVANRGVKSSQDESPASSAENFEAPVETSNAAEPVAVEPIVKEPAITGPAAEKPLTGALSDEPTLINEYAEDAHSEATVDEAVTAEFIDKNIEIDVSSVEESATDDPSEKKPVAIEPVVVEPAIMEPEIEAVEAEKVADEKLKSTGSATEKTTATKAKKSASDKEKPAVEEPAARKTTAKKSAAEKTAEESPKPKTKSTAVKKAAANVSEEDSKDVE